MVKRVYLMLSMMVCVLTSPQMTIADLIIVWTQPNALYIWQNDEIRHIPLSGIFKPILSPHAQHLVLIPVGDDMPEFFVTLRIDGTGWRQIDIPYPNQVVWQSDTVLWLNNYARLSGESVTPVVMTDHLYRVDAETGEIDQWQMGRPFLMTIRQDGLYMVLSHAGQYPNEYGAIRIISLYDETISPIDVLQFPAISLASHVGYFPVVQWMTDNTMRVALPAPDAVYASGVNIPPTQLWRLTVDGQSDLLGEIPARFYAGVVWSSDGRRVSYIMPTVDGDTIVIASPTGEIIAQHLLDSPFGFIIPVPNRHTFLYWDVQQQGRIMMYAEDVPWQMWLNPERGRMVLTSISQDGVTLIHNQDAHIRLAYALFDDQSIHEIVKISEYPSIDVKWLKK